MKAALLLSGYLRTIKINLENIKTKIIDKFDVCDVYLHITKNEKLEDKYFNPMDESSLKEVIDFLKPISLLYEENMLYSGDKTTNNLFNSWMKYYKLNEIRKINEKSVGRYDIIIKSRPDFHLISDLSFDNHEGVIYIPSDSKVDISKLLNPSDPHLCDAFAFGLNELMDKYFSDYESFNSVITEYGSVPETFIYGLLEKNNIPYKKLDIEYAIILSSCNLFAITGDSGSGKSTLAGVLKKFFYNSFVLEGDRYHKWERNDVMWEKFTHLNPESNFISKMNKDIFDLKYGRDVYQVDYDHKNGKFTEKEKIETADNIIVCGLHSLYLENNDVYNFKIFMDTDVNLKYKWKIKRDMKKRGRTFEDVMKQIELRKEDYETYIKPQRDKSDIIINFYTDKNFNIDNIDEDDCIYLKIFVDKKYVLDDILNGFAYNRINYEIFTENNFNVIDFKMYKKCNLLKGYEEGNYYDYIVFVLLNLKK